MTRRAWLASTLGASVAAQQRRQPNFIFILADDQGYGDLGCYGSPYIRTPQIDRMAREGARLTDFYAQPLCGPSRAALLTGSYPVRNSLNFNHIPRAKTGIGPQERTIAQVLKAAGYATAMLGKWHLGDAAPFLPTRHGFDSYYGLPYSNDMWPFHPKIQRTPGENPRLTAARKHAEETGYDGQGQVYPTDWFPDLPLLENERVVERNPDLRKLTGEYTRRALEFIRRNRGQPFFLYVAHAMPHVPLFASEKFAGRSIRGLYGDVVEEIDDSTGRILALVRELGLERDTVVVFASDNGPWLPYGVDAGSAGVLRGGKGGIAEGGIRVPCIWWAPGRLPAGQVNSQMLCTLDVLPTFAKLAGAPLPAHKIDGLDIWPVLTQGRKTPREAFFYYEVQLQYKAEDGRPQNLNRMRALRSGRWKLWLDERGAPQGLYDLYGDVSEKKDVAASHPEIVERLRGLGRVFTAEVTAHTRPLGRLAEG